MIYQPIDPVIEEIHATRARMSEKFGGDLYAIAANAALRQANSERQVWQPKQPSDSRNLSETNATLDSSSHETQPSL